MTEDNQISKETQIKQLKFTLVAALILIAILAGALIYNMQKVKDFNTITSGKYFTEEQCNQKILNNFIPINSQDDVTDNNPTKSINVSATFK